MRFPFIITVLLAAVMSQTGLAFDQQKIDSLKQVLNTTEQDTTRVKVLNELADLLRYNNPDSSILLSQEALKLAKANDFEKGVGHSYQLLGIFSHLKGNLNNALKFYEKALNIQKRRDDRKATTKTLTNMGSVYYSQGNYPQALEYYMQTLKINKSLGNKSDVAAILGNIGLVFYKQGNYPKALEYYFKAMDMSKRIGKERYTAIWLNAIGIVYRHQGDFDKALDYYLRSLTIKKEVGNKNDIANTLGNIGNVYQEKKQYSKAYDYFSKALEISRELGDKHGIASWLTNIGVLYTSVYQADTLFQEEGLAIEGRSAIPRAVLLDSAIHYQKRAYKIFSTIGAKEQLTHSFLSVGDILMLQKRHSAALRYYRKTYRLADSIGALQQKQAGAEGLYQAYKALGRPDKALFWHERYTAHKDSLFNKEKQKELGRQEAQYEWQQKLLEKEKEQEKQQALARERAQRQRIIIGSVSGGLLLVLVFAGFLYNRFRVTRRQKATIEEQKDMVDQKNKEITSSITYAQRIQQAVLVPEEEIKKSLPESFTLLKPQSIVSGDFYYFAEVRGNIIISAIDCTGHGVPGAFMSLIGNDLLNQIVYDQTITSPAQVLNELDKQLEQALRQETELKAELGVEQEEFVRDGMDLAFCVLSPNPSPKEGETAKGEGVTLQYAGANNPLYVISDRRLQIADSELNIHQSATSNFQLNEIPPDPQPIGKQAEKKPFTDKTIQLQKGDTFYLFSDGYPDQFGGTMGKKFMYKRFRQLLLDIQDKSMDEQKQILDNTIEEWMTENDEEQIDDICVLGVHL